VGIARGRFGAWLDIASHKLNALGASTTSTSRQLARHWRNACTAASYYPVIYKERIIGAWHVNGTEPPYVWQIGGVPSRPEASTARAVMKQ
jgi:hypothetical protein